nr:gtp cyclohydrolase 1 [Quercus suber]
MDDLNKSQPRAPKAGAGPSHLVNGHSPLHTSQSSEFGRDETSATYHAIKSSMGALREPLGLDELSLSDKADISSRHVNGSQRGSAAQYEEVEDRDIDEMADKIDAGKVRIARDERDEAVTTPLPANHPESSLTQHPAIDFDGLSWPSVGTLARMQDRESPEDVQKRLKKLSDAVRTILECIGEDPDREGLHGTPERYAKAMMFFTKGYEENLRDIVNNAVFHEDHEELVIVRDIDVYSLCEHHLVPFTGKVCDSAHVFSSSAGPGTPDQTSRARSVRSPEAAGRRCGDGVKSSVHGYAWSGEGRSNNNNKLHAGSHETKSKDARGVLKSPEQRKINLSMRIAVNGVLHLD